MTDQLFKALTDEEKGKYVQWARDNFVAGQEADPLWHPVVREAWEWLQTEADIEAEFDRKMNRLGLYGRTVDRLLGGFYDGRPRTKAQLVALSDDEVYALASTRYG